MKRKASAIVAVLCGVLCAASVLLYMHGVQAQAQAARVDALERYGGESVQACVATRDIEPGEALGASNVAMRPWLVDMLPEDAVLSMEEADGIRISSRILAGEVVSAKRFAGESASVSIPAGLQAVSVELGSAQSLGEMLEAGALVDVYATGATTALLASNVLVAAVETGSYAGKCVTLAVDPAKVQEVIAASQQTGIYLTLPSSTAGRFAGPSSLEGSASSGNPPGSPGALASGEQRESEQEVSEVDGATDEAEKGASDG